MTGTITLAGMKLTGGYSYYSGGAIFMTRDTGNSNEATKLVLDYMTITGNEARNGGGIAVMDTDQLNRLTLEIRNSTIIGNRSADFAVAA